MSLGFSRPGRVGYCVSFAALLLIIGCDGLQNATANGDTRTISLLNTHTKEAITVTYKVNGRYDEAALTRINYVLRDWREEKPTRMDPHLIDLVWEVHREMEASEPVSVICGYRSPGTNEMLRRRSSGVAKFSQHMLGKAMDFYIPGVPLEKLREAGLRASRGGVGYYPSSNFIHLDTGSVRHWPRMPEAQLARVMAKGPLTQVAARESETKTAAFFIPIPFATLFGARDNNTAATPPGAADDATQTSAAARPQQPRPVVVADAKIQKPASKPEKTAERPVTVLPLARPAAAPPVAPATYEIASATSRPVQLRPAQAASLVNRGDANANDVINERGFWQGLPVAEAAQENVVAKTVAKTSAPASRSAGIAVATADPEATGSLAPWPMPARGAEAALAYAPVSHPAAPSRPAAATAVARTTPPAQRDTTVAVERNASQPAHAAVANPVKPGQKFNDPWMRAMIVAPSADDYMSTSLLGAPDYRALSPYLRKPETSVMMTFAQDPHLGMTNEKFAGTAVVFVSTVTFHRLTASLR
jgi:uncharacterized protein YcbK (DUF882 family)